MEVLFVFTDSSKNFLITDKTIQDFNKSQNDINITSSYHPDNKLPLSFIFNSELKKSRSGQTKYDFVIFMHGDVNVNLQSFFKHLLMIHTKYDVIGLAGCKKVFLSQSPFNWFCGSIPYPQGRYGDIIMNNQGKFIESFYNKSTDPGISDTSVGMIDGLCIIFCRTAIESELYFDEQIAPFDFYDSDISLQTLIKYKMRLGVMVEKTLHLSVGRSILSEDFLKYEVVFRNKWNLEIPHGSKLEQMLKRDSQPN